MTREVGADAERVWAVITDLEAWARVLSGVESVERMDGGSGFHVGTRWRETRVMFGRRATEEMEVVAIEPGRSYRVSAGTAATSYSSVLEVEPIGGDRCRLSMSFGARPTGTIARIGAASIGRLFQKATRTMLQRDLDDIADHAQGSRTT